jgi:isopentenyl-diphosphate Delta-isomerase
MTKVTTDSIIEDRKVDHIRINLEKNVQFPHLTTGLERYRFLHTALPEIDLNKIDTTVTLFGKTLRSPLLISSMTGGAELAYRLNRRLAETAQTSGIPCPRYRARYPIVRECWRGTVQLRLRCR